MPNPPQRGVAAIATSDLTKRYGDLVALDSLSIEVEPGEVFGFLGPNGAGKTTTIRLLLGLAHATHGRALLFGRDVHREGTAALAGVAYVPGEFVAWPQLRGGEILDLLGRTHGGYDRAVRDSLCDRFDFDPTKRGRDYSKGNRQKIAIIAALMVRPNLLVLDEPTSGLDPLMERIFRECVAEARERGATVFLSSHQLAEVEAVCDRVAILRRGRLVEVGTLADLSKFDTREVRIRFAAPPTIDLAAITGVEQVRIDGRDVHCHLRGSPNPLLRAIAPIEIDGIDVRAPSLEELFVRYYGVEDQHDERPARKS
jgi:ABC-2 type transport system ATP-binding protein